MFDILLLNVKMDSDYFQIQIDCSFDLLVFRLECTACTWKSRDVFDRDNPPIENNDSNYKSPRGQHKVFNVASSELPRRNDAGYVYYLDHCSPCYKPMSLDEWGTYLDYIDCVHYSL